MHAITLSPDLTMAALLEQWPAAQAVLERHAMACIGCVVAPFCTVREAAGIYHLSVDEFLAELVACVSTRPQSASGDAGETTEG